ncbi:EamA family transporter [Lyticum sinuosum]|uniref:S-adenosylmethionine uptake transporter n=1 Tax=Lyticum sinuosum TaxID=1332059 RepID=A0AAE5AI24_9RICK|nr:EamA family transporter [Lyticum sinuosum]MDZ5761509.1 EamA family transporter [Lyticum sinuosum]
MISISSRLNGILSKIFCLILSAIITLVFVHRNPKIGIFEQIYFANLSATCVIIIWLITTKPYRKNGNQTLYQAISQIDIKWYFVRAILSLIAMTVWSYISKKLGAYEVTLIGYLGLVSPLIISHILDLEKIRLSSVFGIIICILAVFFSLKEENKIISIINILIGLIPSICWGGYEIICKKQSSTDDLILQGFIVFLASVIISSPMIIPNITKIPYNEIIFAFYLGFIRIGVVFTIFLSYKNLSVNSLLIMGYLRLPIMIAINYSIFSEVPLVKTISAAIIIILTNFIIINHNKKIDKNINNIDDITAKK